MSLRNCHSSQKGFSAVEGLLILLIVAIVGSVGVYVVRANHQTEKTVQAGSSNSNNASAQKVATLAIKEWNIALPLTANDAGAYYTYDGVTPDQLSDSIAIFDHNIDTTTNANGVRCEQKDYPLFIINRVKTSDFAKVSDPNSQYFIEETNPSMYKTFANVSDYRFVGRSVQQSAPTCVDLNPSGEFKADTKVDARYRAVRTALKSSYEHAH